MPDRVRNTAAKYKALFSDNTLESLKHQQRLDRSFSWFQVKIRDLLSDNVSITPSLRSYLNGKVFLYNYRAKYRSTLPYYDTFPLVVFTARPSAKYLMGINLHYMTFNQRREFFFRLLDLESMAPESYKGNLKKKEYADMIQGIVQTVIRQKNYKKYYKKYLVNHITSSKIIQIPPSEWMNIVFLPVILTHGKFVDANTHHVSVANVYRDYK